MNFENLCGHMYVMLSPRLRQAQIDKTALIIKPLKIENPETISIGAKCYIGRLAWIMGGSGQNRVTLKIDNNTQIGHFAHIVAMRNVHIESNVLIADKVFISDCTHEYTDVNIPIQCQKICFLKPVTIGEGAWLGENVCVCGASVGRHSVVGANSVVTEDIPDYSIAVGCPARVIKKYNFEKKEWEKIRE